MVDNNEKDEKIIAVHSTDPRMDKRMDIKDFSDHVILEIRHFFETYKELQGKKSTIMGIKGRKEAQKEILRALKRYKETYKE